MNRQGRILIIEDEEEWRNTLVEMLQDDGYTVASASTAAEAQDLLQHNLYHLLILDIQLEKIMGNQDGLLVLGELVRQGLTEAIKVIMLSSFEEFMRTSFRLYKVLDFLKKGDFDNEEFLQEIRQVFAERLKINLALDIRWQKKPEEIVLNLKIENKDIIKNSDFYHLMITELDDLFGRLFFRAKSILVRPIAIGWSGTGVLRVRPFYSTGGGGHEVIVKFGECRKIEEEYSNFVEYVQPFLGGERSTSIIAMRRTAHLAGITYSLLGTAHDRMVDFGEFYRRSDITQITNALDQLFRHTCGAWYANRGNLRLVDLAADYQCLFSNPLEESRQQLAHQLNILQPDERTLVFKALPGKRSFTNPLTQIRDLSFERPTYMCITHGDFNHRNLLIDVAGNTWLIDFQGTGEGHILRDVAALDSTVRFQLLAAEDASLQERLQMEEALLDSIQHFSQIEQLLNTFSSSNQALAKAYATVVHLRTIAYKLVETNPDDDINEYYIALLYNALNTLRFADLLPIQREHALLCASLLAERLALSS